MRPQSENFVKGVATMKFCVAFLLVLTTFSSGAVTRGQTPSRRSTQSTVSKPRNETL